MTAAEERRAVERHVLSSTSLIEDVCLLPRRAGSLDGCVAVVVPRAAELSRQQVLLPGARLRELVAAAVASSPHPVRVARVHVLPVHAAPLPRTPGGEHALERIEQLLDSDGSPSRTASATTS